LESTLHKDKELIEKVQRRFTKMINNMEGNTYEDRFVYFPLSFFRPPAEEKMAP